ncbi:hypothetical protein [Sulfurospirillum sp. UCH001]|uniref:hypothetical protein n=1 Tax=Sulfurospirillum sp. UCH001 TaxID=1581011 RepID=UPI00082EEC36|nr:hypothetical protein [Sulfurospirillum sp. UCH001]
MLTIEVDAKTIAKQVAVEVVKMMQLEIKRQIYPFQIKGDANAGSMIGVTGEAMKQRRHNGFYRDGYHFDKKSDKIIMWNRDALLEESLNDKSLH